MLINNNNICFTTTAMPRPELLERTYASFCRNIKWLDFKQINLFINIDKPQHGMDDIEQKYEDIKSICQHYFAKVIINTSNRGNFAEAVKWIFSQVDTEYVFNLEDDWELLCELPDYVCDFFENKNIKQVGIRGSKNSQPRFVLSPSIMRADFCRYIANNLTSSKNPEEQIRNLTNRQASDIFAYWPYEPEKVMLKDLGRAWMQKTPYAGGFESWTSWRYVANPIRRIIEQKYIDQNVDIDLSKLDGNYRRPNATN